MTTRILLSIAMISSLLLGALPAAAEHPDRDRRDRKIEKVAYKLARATSELYSDAYHARPRHSRRYSRALRSLHELDRRACAFAERVEREGVRSRGTQRALRRLARAYDEARYRVDHLRRGRHLSKDLARLDEYMGRLETRVARVDGRGGRDARDRHNDARERRHEPAHHQGRYGRFDPAERWHATFAWNF